MELVHRNKRECGGGSPASQLPPTEGGDRLDACHTTSGDRAWGIQTLSQTLRPDRYDMPSSLDPLGSSLSALAPRLSGGEA